MDISRLLNPAPSATAAPATESILASESTPSSSALPRPIATILPPPTAWMAESAPAAVPHFAPEHMHHHAHAHPHAHPHPYGYASHPMHPQPHAFHQTAFQPVYSHAHPHAAVHREDSLAFFKMSTPPQSPPTSISAHQGAAAAAAAGNKKLVRPVAPRSEPLPAPVAMRGPASRPLAAMPALVPRGEAEDGDHEHPAELSDDGSSSGSSGANAPCELSREERAQLSAQWWAAGCSSKWSHLFCPWNDCLEDFDGEPAYHVVKHLHYYYVECPFCNYKQERNTSKHKIVSHLQRHLAPVYRCACGRTYSQKQTYVRHIRELRCTAAPSARTPTKRPGTQGVAVWRLVN